MDKKGFTADLRSTLFAALSGRTGADASGRTTGDVRGMLLAAYGEGRRGGVNTRAAAQDLGVSQRTVQRWLAAPGRQRSRPSAGHLRSLATRARQAATTRRGRQAAIAQARKSSMSRYGAKLVVRGDQGPTAQGRQYRRHRKIDLVLDPDAVEAMWSAYEQSGDRGVVSWLESYADQQYVANWGFDSITGLELGDPREMGL